METGNSPKILILDIEWKPAKVYAWQAYDINVSPDQVIDAGGLLCFAAKWLGDPFTLFVSEWDDGHEAMVKDAHHLLSIADAIVTYNGDKYDLPKLMGEFALAGLAPPPPPTSIDVIKSVKKLGFLMNRLAFIGPLLKVGDKVKHEGFDLWVKVMDGDVKAQKTMQKYNIQDVVLLEKLYDRIRPYIRNHPNLGEQAVNSCGACGSGRLQRRGYRRTKAFRIQRVQCTDCGSWSDGVRNKI